MNFREWSQSEVEYGRKVLNSGLAGARSGQEEFLNGKPLSPFIGRVVRNASTPAAIGVLVGVLGSFAEDEDHKCISRSLLFGILGGAIGLGMSIVWQSRRLTASAAGAAFRNMSKVRDEHWLETHPIDYA